MLRTSSLHLRTCTTANEATKRTLLLKTLASSPGDTIIYATTQNDAESVAKFLEQKHMSCKHYHAGMKADERSQVQEWFMRSQKDETQKIVCATIAFGMVRFHGYEI